LNTGEKLQYLHREIRQVNDEPREQPGIERAEVLREFDALGLVVPQELADAYERYNGIFHLNAFLHFLPLREAVDLYKLYASFGEDGGDFGWQKSWFPVFDMNGDVQFCIDLQSNALAIVDIEGGEARKIADHYSQYLDALVEAFQSGNAHFQDEFGFIDIDGKVWRALRTKYGLEPDGW
jgi:hypothetical protein